MFLPAVASARPAAAGLLVPARPMASAARQVAGGAVTVRIARSLVETLAAAGEVEALARAGNGRTLWLYRRESVRHEGHLTIDQPVPGQGPGQEPGASSRAAFYAAVQALGEAPSGSGRRLDFYA
jgi:hypothetical protein